jgi:hypothetical protein
MSRSLLALTAMVVFVSSAAADDPRVRDMYRWIPSDVNLFVAADVKAIYSSPLGTREKWGTKAPINGFSPVIQFLLLGSKTDPATLQDQYEFGVGYMNVNLTMDDLAKREGGARDTIADAEAVLSPRNCYFVAVAPYSIGMCYPANRQEASKWVRFGRANAQPQFAPAIQAGIAAIQPATQFLLVLDLADSIRPEDVRPRIEKSKALKGQNLEAAAKVLGSIQSLRLEIAVTDAISARMTVSFGADVAPIAASAKAILQEVLAKHGARIDDVENWTTEAKGTTITFHGPLVELEFRQIISLLVPPPPQLDNGQVEANNPLAPEIRLQASQRYFQLIQKKLDGLKNPSDKAQREYDAYALWYQKAADCISQLPTANVDAELLKYGQLAVDSLNAIAASARGEEVQVQKADGSFKFGIMNFGPSYGPLYRGGGGRRGGWGGGGGIYLDTNIADINQAKAKAYEQGTQARNDIWMNLMSETDRTKKAMYEKFRVPF